MINLFSIGHSNHPLATFLDLLNQHQIEVLVDVRSQPYSKYTPHFSAAALKTAIISHSLKYLFMGKELGGRPDGAQFYDAAGHVLYSEVAKSPLFLEGINRLQTGAQKYRVALMCSEENPAICHRNLLIARVLTENGVIINHIRGDGSVQPETALINQPTNNSIQLSLFADEEAEQWKSLRSVLPKRAPPNSSIP